MLYTMLQYLNFDMFSRQKSIDTSEESVLEITEVPRLSVICGKRVAQIVLVFWSPTSTT